MPIIKVIRVGDKKQHINVAKNDSSVASFWYLIPDKINTIVNMLNITTCICQPLCSIGVAEIATQ